MSGALGLWKGGQTTGFAGADSWKRVAVGRPRRSFFVSASWKICGGGTVMAIPDDEMVMLPLLETLGAAASMKLGDAVDLFAGRFRLTPDECRQMLPLGSCSVFRSWVSRVSWAKTCLKQAGPIDHPKRGERILAPMGRDLLATKPSAVHLRN